MKKQKHLKTIEKRLLALLMCASMIVTTSPVTTRADENVSTAAGQQETSSVSIITTWQWNDEADILDPETGSLALPGTSEQAPAYFDDVTALLPTQILATVENAVEPITLGDWECDNYPVDGAYTGSYTFTAALPEGYALSEEAEALTVLVELGGTQMYESTESKTVGAFTVITDGVEGTDYTYENNVLTIMTDKAITIANTDPTTATTDRIEVASGVSANITLAGVNISSAGYPAFKIEDDSTGNVTIILKDGTENTLKGGTYSAGLQKNGNVAGIGKLTIKGGTEGTGKLEATGSQDNGAGIGGYNKKSCSNIEISGGTVTANGGEYAAGIGGGKGGTGSNITISGGTVTANGGHSGAGIGGSYTGSGSDITISGGSVKAVAGTDANDIGGGSGNGAVTPTLADGTTPVYLLEIPNPDSAEVLIDGVSYKPVNHKAVDGTDTNLYAYLTGAEHRVQVGNKTIFYTFDSENSTFAVAPLIAYATNGGTLTYDTDYTYENNVLTIKSATPITIANKDPNTATTDRIEVASGVSANITLDGVNIDVSSSEYTAAAFKIADDSTGNVTITLADGTENTLKSERDCAGLQKNGNVEGIGKLTIQGGTNGTGELTATGGMNGAGIGGGNGGSGSNITIRGGTVTATYGYGGYGAGIGGGNGGSGSNITISGGTVTARSYCGAGIGGGYNGSGSDITISGGTVTANSYDGAGIGGGKVSSNGGSGSNIEISGGTVNASSYDGAGIGGGEYGTGSDIKISGGTVTATGGSYAAGIGGGEYAAGSNITISGGTVKAVAGTDANAIGGGVGQEAVTPTSDGTTPVYLFEIANNSGAAIMINNNAYPAEHTYYDFESSQYVTEKKIYAYLPAKTVTEPNVVIVGTETTKYIYDNSKWRIVPTVTAPTPNELAYTGEDQSLVAAGTTSGGTMVYSLSEYGTYTETIPTGTGAGTYTVWYKVEGNEDYAATLPASVSVTIAKASPVITNADTVRNQSTVYGSGEFTAPVAEVTGTVTYKVGETTYDAEQLKTYLKGKNVSDSSVEVEYTFAPIDTTNYKEVTGTITFTVAPATPEMTWGTTSQSAAYTGSEIATGKLTPPNVTLKNSESYSGTFTYSYRVQGSSAAFTFGLPTNIGTYEVKASIAADGNYTAAETTGTMTLTIDWLNTDVAAVLTNQINIPLSGNDWWAQSVTFTAPTGFTISNNVDGTYGTSFVYDTQTGADGTGVTYYLKNSNGEIAQKTATVRIDRTAPTWPENGGITIKNNWWKSLLNTISFGLFYKDATLDVKASAADDLSGVASYYYYVDTTGSTTVLSSDELANKTFTEKAGSGTQTLKSLSVDGKYVVYAYAVDNAGNKSDYVCTNGVVLDTIAPKIGTITTPSKEALTLTDTSAKISFTGSEAGTCFYMIKKSDETAPASIDDFATSDTDSQGMTVWTAKTGVFSVEMTTEAKQITLSNLNPNTTYTLYLAAVDKAGNSSELVYRGPFTTCKTMPAITKNPTISGTYGQTVADMTLTNGVAKVGSNVITGTWAVTDSNKTAVPCVGTTDTYQVTFTPDDTYGDIYDTVIVAVKPNVSKKAITVTADDKTKTYGQANPAFTYAITEGTLVGTDTEEALGITLTCAANESSPVKAGGYAITGTTNSANYQVTVIPGVLTIEKATPTITASNYTKTYGDIKFFLDATDDSAEASLRYAVTESKDPSTSPVEKDAVVTVDARGYVTIIGAGTAKITASLPETTNYNAASKEIAIVVNQAAYPPNRPGTAMFVSNSCTHVGDVPLTGDWEWQNGDTELRPGENNGTAEYIGADKANYAYTTADVSITKSHECDHVAGEILYTVNGDYAPTCTTAGRGHRECTICGKLIESGILVNPAHSFSSTWTIDVPATTTSEGSKSHHCTREGCEAKNDITVVPKLVISDGGNSNNESSNNESSGSTTTETPAVEGPAVEAPATNKPNTTKKPAESKPDTEAPFIKSDNGKEGWEAIRDEVKGTTAGNSVVIDMNGASVVPGDVIADIRGKDITLVFDMGNGITWSINGKSITSDQIGDINFSVTVRSSNIPVDVINNVSGERYSKQISLAYDGEFGFTAVLSINMDKKNAGLFANLFYYNEGTGELEFICYDEIAEDGIAELTFTHASEYTIVVDTVLMDGSAQALEETEEEGTEASEATVTEAPKEKGGLPWWIILVCAIVIVAGVGVFFVVRKKTDDLDE